MNSLDMELTKVVLGILWHTVAEYRNGTIIVGLSEARVNGIAVNAVCNLWTRTVALSTGISAEVLRDRLQAILDGDTRADMTRPNMN